MARQVFDMIDTDGSGSLEKQEIVRSVTQDTKVISFLVNCGEPNLQFLLVPRRLQKALDEIDTDGSGDISKGAFQGGKRVRNSQLQRLLSRPFSTRFG